MNYLSPSPTAHNKTYGPRSGFGSGCGLPPQKKYMKKLDTKGPQAGENTKKVVPLGDEMWICVHLFARFEMSDRRGRWRRLGFNATAAHPLAGHDWESAVHLHFQIRDHDQDELVAVYLPTHAIHAVNQRKANGMPAFTLHYTEVLMASSESGNNGKAISVGFEINRWSVEWINNSKFTKRKFFTLLSFSWDNIYTR